MKTIAIRTLLTCGAMLALSACATLAPPPPPPAGERMARPDGRSAVNKRQYLDQRSGRYYYFDPVRKAYFWEDGRPKT